MASLDPVSRMPRLEPEQRLDLCREPSESTLIPALFVIGLAISIALAGCALLAFGLWRLAGSPQIS